MREIGAETYGLGSPPQVRGKLHSSLTPSERQRITPAGAGKTVNPSSRRGVKWDHPRRCGENHKGGQYMKLETGSPPQVRGKRWSEVRDKNACRITPAGAGKTIAGSCNQRRRAGSPPQVRGKHLDSSFTASRDGITPAGAGKTASADFFVCLREDHPRRCGENQFNAKVSGTGFGSPPQVRGKH